MGLPAKDYIPAQSITPGYIYMPESTMDGIALRFRLRA